MAKENIFILGKGFIEYSKAVDRELYDLYLLKDKTITEEPAGGFKEIFTVDYSSKAALISSLEDINIKPDGIVCIYENYVQAKAWAGEYFNLNILSEESAFAASNKVEMRKRFLAFDPSITPAFKKVESFADIDDFAKHYNYPIIIKPANLSKSLLVYKCDNYEQAKVSYAQIVKLLAETYQKYNIHDSSGEILVEEHLTGSMHTVAAFCDKEGEIFMCEDIVDNLTAQNIGFNDNFLYLRSIPSDLNDSQKTEVLKVAEKGMHALNIKGCPGHVEIFYTKNGPKIIEIGARLGGYRSRMYMLANGIDLVKAELAVATGKEIDLTKHYEKYVNVFEIFPEKEGKFESISALQEIKRLPSLYSLNCKTVERQMVGPSKNGYKFTLNIILHHSDKKLIQKDIDFIKSNVKVNLK